MPRTMLDTKIRICDLRRPRSLHNVRVICKIIMTKVFARIVLFILRVKLENNRMLCLSGRILREASNIQYALRSLFFRSFFHQHPEAYFKNWTK